jgi:hypothetical protein
MDMRGDGMKLLLFKVKKERRQFAAGRNKSFPVERVLFSLFILTFFIMVIAQTVLVTPSLRTFFSADEQNEGTPLELEEFLYKEGKIELELIGTDSNNDLKVLVNGDEVAAFADKNLFIPVRDGDVVEIDGSALQQQEEVRIISKSENISTSCVGKSIRIENGIRKLVKVRVE